MTENKSNFC